MANTTRFRSTYTGAQIEALLASIAYKIDESYIVNDFTTGGAGKVASAETVKILKMQLDELYEPENLLTLLESIDNFNLFTDAEKAKLGAYPNFDPILHEKVVKFDDGFKGVFSNAAARDAALNTATYSGKEFVILLNDGNGFQVLQYWDDTANVWKNASYPMDTSQGVSLEIEFPGLRPFMSFPKATTSTIKLVLTAVVDTFVETKEILVSSNGVDTFITELADIGNGDLMDVGSDILGDNIRIIIDNKTANTLYKAQVIAQI